MGLNGRDVESAQKFTDRTDGRDGTDVTGGSISRLLIAFPTKYFALMCWILRLHHGYPVKSGNVPLEYEK